jgi:hypothetical protein
MSRALNKNRRRPNRHKKQPFIRLHPDEMRQREPLPKIGSTEDVYGKCSSADNLGQRSSHVKPISIR